MIKKIKQLVLSLGVVGLLATPMLAVVPASAAAFDNLSGNQSIQDSVTCGSDLKTSGNCSAAQATTGDNQSIDSILRLIVNILSVLVGFIAVVMIIFGGIKYITSGGDSGNISGAKNTIVYAIVGLVIVALAQVLVHFVLAHVAGVSNS